MTTLSFENLLATYTVRVHKTALGMLGDEQEARDVAQEALTRAYASRHRYDHKRPFYPWLYRIVRNACVDARRRRRYSVQPGLETDRVPSQAETPLDKLDRTEAIQRLRWGMSQLSNVQREVLAMRHFQDLSYAEMAELLEVPEGTVMSRLFRARRALAQVLKERP
jgi:RNA polymerase sigma-70 factor, ECF subfamily